MTPTETATILRQFNEWRRSEDETVEQPDPREIGEAIDAAIEMIERLEAAEKDNALKEKLIDRLALELNSTSLKRDALRARFETMEKQEPVAWLHETRRDSDVVTDAVKHVWGKVAVGSLAAYSIPLYLAPGAQPAPSVPDGFSREDLEAVADGLDGYEKTVNVGNVTGGGDDHLESTTAYAARFIRAMLAAAPEAKL